LIIKTGTTYPDIRLTEGDFEDMMARAVSGILPVTVIDAKHVADYPALPDIAGILATGSHDMVTEQQPWSERLAQWIRHAVNQEVPYLGICYGHQLLAHAFGGVVDYHPQGIEIGTHLIATHDAADDDLLFARVPRRFNAHLVHRQSVRQLPVGATLLAYSHVEPVQAFRQGKYAWGVQFHPEFTEHTMRGYVGALATALSHEGVAVRETIDAVKQTTDAHSLLQRFAVLSKTLNHYLSVQPAS
jgi:GMP synthase (glutamine-hydrolysing)